MTEITDTFYFQQVVDLAMAMAEGGEAVTVDTVDMDIVVTTEEAGDTMAKS